MKLFRRYSDTPLLELRLDYGSGRTVANRPYVWFQELEDGQVRRRMKAIPLPIEQATTLVEWSLDFLLATSGQAGASLRLHEFFKTLGFDVRQKKGRAPRKANRRATASSVRQFLRKFAFWRKEAA